MQDERETVQRISRVLLMEVEVSSITRKNSKIEDGTASQQEERQFVYFQLFSVLGKDEDEEYTMDLRKKCFLQTADGNTNGSNTVMKQYQQQRMTRCTMDISRGFAR